MTNRSSFTRRQRPSHAFTLVELLVVIAIIGILVALLIPAVMRATNTARVGAMSTEIANLSSAIQSFQTKFNAGFPADFGFTHYINNNPNFASYNKIEDVNRRLERLFRTRRRPNPNYQNLDITIDDVPINPFTGEFVRFEDLDSGEALAFWLIGFTNNSQRPLTGTFDATISPRRFPVLYLPKEEEVPNANEYQNLLSTYYLPDKDPVFEFDVNRLFDRDKDGFPEYYPAYGGQLPYIYFSSDNYATYYRQDVTYANPFVHYVFGASGQQVVPSVSVPRPYLANATPFRQTNNRSMMIQNKQDFAESATFQIIAPGMDGKFGLQVKWDDGMKQPSVFSYPDGPYPDEAHQDNITNFARGTLESQLP